MTVTARTIKNYQVEISGGSHIFYADEPPGVGDDTAPCPYDLLLGALGSCVVITLHMYAQRKQWPLESVTVEMDIRQELARDCPDAKSPPDAKVNVIEKRLSFTGDLDEAQVNRLLEIADRCPIQRVLTGEVLIHASLIDGT